MGQSFLTIKSRFTTALTLMASCIIGEQSKTTITAQVKSTKIGVRTGA